MTFRQYRTAPLETAGYPPGLGYILGNEAVERFSFYGMKAVLTLYLTHYLMDCNHHSDVMKPEEAASVVHLFNALVYATPLLGALLSDWLLGKYKVILFLSLVYCLGHALLAILCGREAVYWGLLVIAMGAGGIKPCVTAHLGDQFGPANQQLQRNAFSWFYFSINFGSFFSTLLTPWLLAHPKFGPAWAFGLPGVLMAVATAVFWWGRFRYAHIPPAGSTILQSLTQSSTLYAIARLLPVYVFIVIFWALYDQTGTSWVTQGERMPGQLGVISLFGHAWPVSISASQMQAINPILVLMLIPLVNAVIVPGLERATGKPIPRLWLVATGLILTAISFVATAAIEAALDRGQPLHLLWQSVPYFLLTLAEVLVYGTCLEFTYSQSPPSLKSFMMAVFLATAALGNLLTASVNRYLQNNPHLLNGPNYYLFFAGVMGVAAVLFLPIAVFYRPSTQLYQPETGAVPANGN